MHAAAKNATNSSKMAAKKKTAQELQQRLTQRFKDGTEVINDPQYLVEVRNALRQIIRERNDVLYKAKDAAGNHADIRLKRSAYDEINEMELKATGGEGVRPEFIRDEYIKLIYKKGGQSRRIRDFIQEIGTKAFYSTIDYYKKAEQPRPSQAQRG